VRERLEDRSRAEARKKELGARGQKEPTTYELTLKSADEPGLPAPVGKTNAVAKANDPHAAGKTPAEGAKADPDEEGEPEKESDQAVDVHLREAERILLDLIELSGGGTKKGVATSIAR
jgi:hypothetical protein